MKFYPRITHSKSFIRKMSRYSVITEGEKVAKPILDDRNYRFIRLPNNLHALVVQDPKLDKAAAALDVHVGAFKDKKYGIPGLAHFCEHLLFMGTEKYPSENAYSQYLAKYSGHLNAYTASEHTNYYFEVDANALHGALDRFSQFFILPLFLKSCQEREIRAVDSENKKNLQNDTWRLYQLDKLTGNSNHPYSGFLTGNYSTLGTDPTKSGLDVRDILIKYWGESYLSNLMSLVIIGKEDVDQLSEWAYDMFHQVKDSKLDRPAYDNNLIYSPDQLQKLIKAVPIMNHDKLELSFLIPDDQESNWASKPYLYYLHFLGHEGKGSIFLWAKEKGWANELSAGGYKVCSGSFTFAVDIDLTQEGLLHWEEIVEAVFAYLKLVEPVEWRYKEIADQLEINFRFQQKQNALQTALRLSGKLCQFWDTIPAEYILSDTVFREYDPEIIRKFGDYLSVDNLRILLSSQTFKELPKKEKWYGTNYSIEEIDPNLKQSLLSTDPAKFAGENGGLHLPQKNLFIPGEFSVKGSKREPAGKHPWLLTDLPRQQLWWKQDDTFLVPKGTVKSHFHFPLLNDTAKNAMMTQLFTELVSDELNEVSYYAELVGLSVSLQAWRFGLLCRVTGYNDKLQVLLEQTISKLLEFQPKRERFDNIKTKLTQDLENFLFKVPYNQIGTHLLTFINEKTYDNDEKLAEIQRITFEDLQRFIKELWAGGVFAETLVQGNFTRSDAEGFSHLFDKKFEDLKQIKAVPKLQLYVLKEPLRNSVTLGDPQNINSCIEYYIEVGDVADDNLRVLTDLVATIAQEPCFNQLRTKEQLGYVVFSSTRSTRTEIGYRILIQSERTTDYLEYRIEAFLLKFGKYVEELLQEEFDGFKKALKAKKLTKLKNLSEETNRFWKHITDGYYEFAAHEKHVEILERVSLGQFQEFYRKYISVLGGNEKRLVVHLKLQAPIEQPKAKLLQAATINHLYEEGYEFEDVDEIIEANAEAPFSELATKIIESLKDQNDIVDVSVAAKKLADALSLRTVQPVPSEYPKGKEVTLNEFKRSAGLGAVPAPVQPLLEFYLSDDSHL